MAGSPDMAGRLRSIAKIVIVDIAAPLIAYSLLMEYFNAHPLP